ncbi:hypothetical protein BaRGS_00016998 [Batillaria attramentaria]|uniref:Uncharacterized protein n=1 Tax=Batillaria attramentaria TaxID=370345 RepID=A0ABD0KY78_9CAEN
MCKVHSSGRAGIVRVSLGLFPAWANEIWRVHPLASSPAIRHRTDELTRHLSSLGGGRNVAIAHARGNRSDVLWDYFVAAWNQPNDSNADRDSAKDSGNISVIRASYKRGLIDK